jgi:diguanylate cyclase (GGDEF)-like protein/PAS domain S-box-containing protein
MPEKLLDPAAPPSARNVAIDPLYGSLIESRQRWQHLVRLASDLAFETDAEGRFVFVFPDSILGWSASDLIGRRSEMLLDEAGGHAFNPFRPNLAIRSQIVWVRRGDGSMVCMNFSADPLVDGNGRIAGCRGTAKDITEPSARHAKIAAKLLRGEVLDYILWCVAQEVMAPRMMDAALMSLTNALAAEGAAVVAVSEEGRVDLLHESGPSPPAVYEAAATMLVERGVGPNTALTADGQLVLAVGCQTRFGANAVLAIWRSAGSRPWDHDDTLLVGSAARIIRMILEHEAIQHEMGRQARTDPLTGLLNRRAFLEELQRHVDRLDREDSPGTLMFADLDSFKEVNDRLGHDKGDQTLMLVAKILRDMSRPADLIARLGGDEFAVWMSGADQLTAAERAEHLRGTVPAELAALLGEAIPGLGMSVGIACRRGGSHESIESLLHRADVAMYEVKRGGRGSWRVSLLEAG